MKNMTNERYRTVIISAMKRNVTVLLQCKYNSAKFNIRLKSYVMMIPVKIISTFNKCRLYKNENRLEGII